MKKIIIGISVLGVGLVSIFAFTEKSLENTEPAFEYEILQKWELPEVLEEVSGIAWMEDNRIACVQDENGTIFFYNLKTSELENSSVNFAGGGDYEGITVVGKDAYVLRSDGVIFEVLGFQERDPKVKKHVTQTNRLPGINIEGLCADPANNRLILAVKEREELPEQKEIFAFPLNKKDSESDPLFLVDLSSPIFEKVNDQLEKKFAPGEIGTHPKTEEYYILDGTRPKLLIAEKDGTLKELYILDPKDFGNPEGLTFNPEGDLFISNEAENAPANILQVSLNRRSN